MKNIKCIKAAVFFIFTAVTLFFPASSSTSAYSYGLRSGDLDGTIVSASKKYDVPLAFFIAVMKAESGFNINALSAKGAVGLMQVMPETGRELNMNVRNPLSNITAGAEYLHYCLKRFGFEPVPALACYNAGPESVKTVYIKNRPKFIIPPYRQTEIYILRVFKYYNYYRKMLK
ncbi:MAG: lytic transglycosylase domain-containing protein [bacterium]